MVADGLGWRNDPEDTELTNGDGRPSRIAAAGPGEHSICILDWYGATDMDVRCARCTEWREVISRSDPRPLRCITAHRRSELRAAFQLVYDRYYRDGLATWNRHGLRILPHQLLDTSWVLLARRGRSCLGTLSLIEDGAMGLPMEQLYPEEIWRLRRRQGRIAELTCFALQDQSAAESLTVLRHCCNRLARSGFAGTSTNL